MSESGNFDVAKVAALARLEIDPSEEEQIHQDMENILVYIGKLSELDVEGVEPMAHVLPIKNICREDEVGDSFPRETMLANAPDTVEGELIKVHQVVDSH